MLNMMAESLPFIVASAPVHNSKWEHWPSGRSALTTATGQFLHLGPTEEIRHWPKVRQGPRQALLWQPAVSGQGWTEHYLHSPISDVILMRTSPYARFCVSRGDTGPGRSYVTPDSSGREGILGLCPCPRSSCSQLWMWLLGLITAWQ